MLFQSYCNNSSKIFNVCTISKTFVFFSSIVQTSYQSPNIAKHFFVVVVEAFQYQTYILFTCDVYNSNNHLVFKLVNASRFKVVPAEIGKKYRKSLSCVPSHSINERIFFGAHCTLCQPYQKTCLSCWFLHWKVGGNSLLSFILTYVVKRGCSTPIQVNV